ncbi:putative zinc finger domain-containing protein [Rosellinia necatrix]|uniref:Putative zinc finger domain-containing protein n=1 Tax=Rosellinia necatrix TaxID=77044 RepID=A0A1W2TS76_ROSNE|nr:putative zinc finger domain-containing protein [Rosellinia necatrix]
MDQLPVELLQRVLTHLDIETLRSAALSCRLVFGAFRGAEELITGAALVRQIDRRVLPEAILVQEAREGLGTASVGKGIEFFTKNPGRGRESAAAAVPTRRRKRWSLAAALTLVRFHAKVGHLAAQAAREALARRPGLLVAGQPDGPTRAERCRFELAVYRFELYCNVVGRLWSADGWAIWDMFFRHFALWELEQLACIHEYFVRVVSRPFNFLVDHDVTWGYLEVPYIDQHVSEHAEALLAEGVNKIYSLSRASGYAECRALLSRGEDRNGEPARLRRFLGLALQEAGNLNLIPPCALEDMSAPLVALVAGHPFRCNLNDDDYDDDDDDDPGPSDMWAWVNRAREPGELVADPDARVHRAWAFPFWDVARLRAAGLLRRENLDLGLDLDDDDRDRDYAIPGFGFWRWRRNRLELELGRDFGAPERLAWLEDTQRERAAIWHAGGRGYYAPGDQSRVEWTGGAGRDRPQVVVVPPWRR